MLRLDFLKQKKNWELQQAQLAELHNIEEDQEPAAQYGEHTIPVDLAELEQQEYEQQELQEMEALLDLLDTSYVDNLQMSIAEDDRQSEHFGSDDGDDLNFLMDSIRHGYNDNTTKEPQHGDYDDEQMDLT